MLTAAELYAELKQDPSGLYVGIASEVEYSMAINSVRSSIEVTRTSRDIGYSAGRVVDVLPRQVLVDAFDEDEVSSQPTEVRDTFLFIFAADQFEFTGGLKAQILGLTGSGNMLNTRDKLISLQTREGSRAEQLQGVSVSGNEMLAANNWAVKNGQPRLW